MKAKLTLLLLLTSFVCNTSFAASGLYVAAGVGIGILDPQNKSSKDPRGYGLDVGFNINKRIGLEMGYANLGLAKNGVKYDYARVGGTYNVGQTRSGAKLFLASGVSKLLHDNEDHVNEDVQVYGTIGFILNNKQAKPRVSYTIYSKDAAMIFFSLVKEF